MGTEEVRYQEIFKRLKRLEQENKELRLFKQKCNDNLKEIQKDNQYYFNALADNIPGYIAYVNVKTLKYEFVNKAFQDSFSIPREKIVGSHIKDIIGETNYKFALKYIKEVRKGKSISYENVFNLQNGKRWIKVNYVPHFNEKGEVISIIVLSYDITDKKLAEIELKKSEHFLRVANSTKDKFFSIIAHDLKNPFNAILSLSEVAIKKQEKYDAKKIEQYFSAIHYASENAYRLLEDLLQWSQAQEGSLAFTPEQFTLKEMVAEVSNLFASSIKSKSIKFKNLINNDLEAFADINMTKAVLRNLINNAIKFTDKKGRITITAQNSKDKTVISVEDNGVGIDKYRLEKLFNPNEYHTTSGTKKEKGTGLGLVLCKEFVEKHNGEIWAESEVGKGTIFHFSLPFENTN